MGCGRGDTPCKEWIADLFDSALEENINVLESKGKTYFSVDYIKYTTKDFTFQLMVVLPIWIWCFVCLPREVNNSNKVIIIFPKWDDRCFHPNGKGLWLVRVYSLYSEYMAYCFYYYLLTKWSDGCKNGSRYHHLIGFWNNIYCPIIFWCWWCKLINKYSYYLVWICRKTCQFTGKR
jgi:hypothetical protein